jgi:hypothetical protein
MIAFDVLQQQINQIRRFSSNPSNTTCSYSSSAPRHTAKTAKSGTIAIVSPGL